VGQQDARRRPNGERQRLEKTHDALAMRAEQVFEARRELHVAFRQGDAVDVRHLVVAQQHDHRVGAELLLQLDDSQQHLQAAVSIQRAVAMDQVAQEDQALSLAALAQRVKESDAAGERIQIAVQIGHHEGGPVGECDESIRHGHLSTCLDTIGLPGRQYTTNTVAPGRLPCENRPYWRE